jgi:uncharacterized protein (TIGR04255 family)
MPIPVEEAFGRLNHAPISEAILELRGRALTAWDEASVLPRFRAALPEYPRFESQRRSSQNIQFATESGQPTVGPVLDHGWAGVRFDSADRKYVAHFQRDAFSFSRLAPYETWALFSAEAARVLQLYLEVTQVNEAQRIGLRFINQFSPPNPIFELADIFNDLPSASPQNLPMERVAFFHRDTYRFPGAPYFVNVNRTLDWQAGESTLPIPKIILDIDVFTESVRPAKMTDVKNCLMEMRWIKNKVFFGSLTDKVIHSFR